MNSITGTDIWYYFICHRECWLMMHRITPDAEDENLEIGRFIHEYRYGRSQKEVSIGSIQLDRLKTKGGTLIVQEIKKSSSFKKSARYQLLYYLLTLKKMGIEAQGELSFPEERRKEVVQLTEEDEKALYRAMDDIRQLSRLPVPPPPKKIIFCKKCAYREYCWAEG